MLKLHAQLQPFKPTEEDTFDWVKAAHLLNRAGFGGTHEEIEKVLKLGPDDALDWLMDFPNAAADEQSETDIPDLSTIENYPRNFREIQKMMAGKSEEERKQLRQKLMGDNFKAINATIAWWMKRMVRGAQPLHEKLVLFWHGHFTTSAKDERSAWLMWQQNELHRRMAAGNFKDYVHKISRDPAMLDYLNNNQNRKQHPNENYARELMELFTLGIGNYTEADIKEAARAFTGWGHDGDQFNFREREHDEGTKNFFGRSGNFDGDDIINIIFQHPACPKYIAGKLFRFFAHDEPDEPLLASLGAMFRDARFELRPLIRTILSSKAFYSDKAFGVQIKSPVQLVVGTARLLEVTIPENLLRPGAPNRGGGGSLQQMGQMPFYPPNVKGWPGGHAWISTSTLFVRYNTAVNMAGGAPLPQAKAGRKRAKLRAGAPSSSNNFSPQGEGGAEDIVDDWVARLIQRPIDDEKRQVLISALGDEPDNRDSIKKMVQLILSMPEYQLC